MNTESRNTESRNTEQETKAELLARLDVMEAMMQEGRKSTQYNGWIFVLWGVVLMIAIAWSSHPVWGASFAWPVTMTTAWIVMIVGIRRQKRGRPNTVIGRSIGAIWTGLGIAMGVYCFSIASSGHFELHTFLVAPGALLGAANFASAMILRWKAQFLVAGIWWGSAIAICFVPPTYTIPIFAGALMLGYFGFGLYLMYLERRDRRNATTAVQHG